MNQENEPQYLSDVTSGPEGVSWDDGDDTHNEEISPPSGDEEEPRDAEWEDVADEDTLDDERGPKHLKLGVQNKQLFTFKRLLQHFAVATNQKLSSMTLFLKLFKHYKPKPDYDNLPSSGSVLLKVNGGDFCKSGSKQKTLPAATPMGKSGKYFHFGLEDGLMGRSPGVVFQDAGILQYVSVYSKHPEILPDCIQKQVSG